MNKIMKRSGLVLSLVAVMNSLPAGAEQGNHGGYSNHGGYGYGRGYGYGALGLGLGLGAIYLANPYVYAQPYNPPIVIDNRVLPIQGPQGSGSWFYCDSAGAYYPYVLQCQEPWRRVLPPSGPSGPSGVQY